MTDTAVEQAISPITTEDFDAVANLLKKLTGIHLNPNKKAMVVGRLSKRVRQTGTSSIRDYCSLLTSPDKHAERDVFISALTTNMTRFHREAHHFTHLADQVLPDLIKFAQRGGRVRLWSAGCSSGEEAYGLAFHVLQACPEAARLDLRILATDIDKSSLAKAVTGTYAEACLAQLPDKFATRFFDRSQSPAGMARVSQEPRELISFRWLNLNSDWPFKGKFDAIMCRNVAIYFDPDTQANLWQRLADRLQQNGMLYIGHSEALPADVAKRVRAEGTGMYRNGTRQEKTTG